MRSFFALFAVAAALSPALIITAIRADDISIADIVEGTASEDSVAAISQTMRVGLASTLAAIAKHHGGAEELAGLRHLSQHPPDAFTGFIEERHLTGMKRIDTDLARDAAADLMHGALQHAVELTSSGGVETCGANLDDTGAERGAAASGKGWSDVIAMTTERVHLLFSGPTPCDICDGRGARCGGEDAEEKSDWRSRAAQQSAIDASVAYEQAKEHVEDMGFTQSLYEHEDHKMLLEVKLGGSKAAQVISRFISDHPQITDEQLAQLRQAEQLEPSKAHGEHTFGLLKSIVGAIVIKASAEVATAEQALEASCQGSLRHRKRWKKLGGFWGNVTQIYKKEMSRIKQEGGEVWAFFGFLKIAVAWTIPTTPLQALNLELPGLGINCQPLGECLKRIMVAGKGILKFVWHLLSIPMRVIVLGLRVLLEKLGWTKILNGVSTAVGAAKRVGKTVGNWFSENFGFGSKDDEDQAEHPSLVPAAEALGASFSACQSCPLRLMFGLSIKVTGPAHSVKIGSIPQNLATLKKCATACVKVAWRALGRMTSSTEKLYWSETCTPHSVGMCMMIARTRQCAPEWRTLPDINKKIHPLKAIATFNDAKVNTGALNAVKTFFKSKILRKSKEALLEQDRQKLDGSQICSLLDNKAFMEVRRDASGQLTCPMDDHGGAAKGCGSTFEWFKTDSSCGRFKAGTGCTHVFKKMMAAEKASKAAATKLQSRKNEELKLARRVAQREQDQEYLDSVESKWHNIDTLPCEWSAPKFRMDQVLKRCAKAFNCYEPPPSASPRVNDNKRPEGQRQSASASAVAFKFTPERLMSVVRKHIDSADYLRASAEELMSPEEASRALVEELSGLLQVSRQVEDSKKELAMFCQHQWKLQPRRVFRHPLWSGRCATWEEKDFPVASKGNRPLSFMGDVMPFTKGSSLSHLDEKPGEKGMQFMAAGKNPHEYMDTKPGQIFNRGMLLADMIGAASSDEKVCNCICCTNRPPPSSSLCEQEPAGQFEIVGEKSDEEACNYQACAARFPFACPKDPRSATEVTRGLQENQQDMRRAGVNLAKIEIRNRPEHGGSRSCKQSAEFVEKLVTEGSEALRKELKWWKKQHRTYRDKTKRCEKQMVEASQESALLNILESNPGARKGPNFLLWYVKHDAHGTITFTSRIPSGINRKSRPAGIRHPFRHYGVDWRLAVATTIVGEDPVECQVVKVLDEEDQLQCKSDGTMPNLGQDAMSRRRGVPFVIVRGEVSPRHRGTIEFVGRRSGHEATVSDAKADAAAAKPSEPSSVSSGPASASTNHFELVSRGTCEGSNFAPLGSETDCEKAAPSLPDNTKYAKAVSAGTRPKGCYRLGTKLYFNRDSNGKDCMAERRCVCKAQHNADQTAKDQAAEAAKREAEAIAAAKADAEAAAKKELDAAAKAKEQADAAAKAQKEAEAAAAKKLERAAQAKKEAEAEPVVKCDALVGVSVSASASRAANPVCCTKKGNRYPSWRASCYRSEHEVSRFDCCKKTPAEEAAAAKQKEPVGGSNARETTLETLPAAGKRGESSDNKVEDAGEQRKRGRKGRIPKVPAGLSEVVPNIRKLWRRRKNNYKQ